MDELEMQKYLFDLQGYLVLDDVLSAQEVATLNALIDRQELPPPGRTERFGSAPTGSGFLAWGQPFVDLLDHPRVLSVLRFRLGDCFRLDRIYGIYMQAGMPRGHLHADYGASSPMSGAQPGQFYRAPETELVNGFIVVSWNLAPTGPDYGGFCCIPGSHKSHYRLPQAIAEAPATSPAVVVPEAGPGSVILFTESLTHGTTAWRGPHQRRSLLYKYCVSQMAWTSERVDRPANAPLTRRQQILFSAPADPHRHFPSLFVAADT